MRRTTAACRTLVAALVLAATALTVIAGPANAVTGNQPLVIVLCKFPDQTEEPQDVGYFQQLFGESGAGKRAVFDYWKDVSYGNLDLTGTVVKGWYTAEKNVGDFNTAARSDQIDTCAKQAAAEVDFTKFAGFAVITNHRNLNGPLFGGYGTWVIGGKSYTMGGMAAEWDQQLSGILHESAHLFQIDHNWRVSGPTEYGDPYDIGSCLNCYGTTAHSFQGMGGPGLNAIRLAMSGWLPPTRVLSDFTTDSCTQRTVQMAALNHPEASGVQQSRIPAAVPIGSVTTSDYYSVELRSATGWDAGFGADTFLLDLKGKDNRSYWVDAAGALTTGREYVDAPNKTYVAVNSITPSSSTGLVTLGSCKIKANLTDTSADGGTYHDTATLSTDLKVDGSNAPIPNARVTLTIGAQSCTALSDSAGRAVCPMYLDQPAGAYTLTASFAGTAAYSGQTAAGTFTINKRATGLRYDGPTTVTYHAPLTMRGSLTEDGGFPIGAQAVTFAAGTGAGQQTCTANTNSTGQADCTIASVEQIPGALTIETSYPGNAAYLASAVSTPLTVAKRATLVRFDGPGNIANDAPAVMHGTLTEDNGAPIGGRSVLFTVGSGGTAQTCAATTSADGRAACTIATVAQPGAATSASIQVTFAGDPYYLGSGTAASAKLLYYTGRSFAVTSALVVLPPSVVSDTGEISTAAASATTKTAATVANPLLKASGLTASVTTGNGKSTGQAAAANVTIGILGLPAIRVTNVRATSESGCRTDRYTADATGGVTIEGLSIAGILQSSASVAPNTVLRVGTATITLNEQQPVPGSSAGLLVNALHVRAPGLADVVIASARSDVHNCP